MKKGYVISSGVLAALLSSVCCITPVFSLLAGISGIAATFSWMEPFRPYLITLTIGVLAFAWYQKLKPRTQEEINCACEEDEKPSFWQSRRFLGMVSVFAVLMLAFPSYSHIFYPSLNGSQASTVFAQDTTGTFKITLDVKGMTCSGCENHIIHEVGKLDGIKLVEASYAKSTTTIEYIGSKLAKEDIIEAINKTGYQVVGKPKDQ